MSSTPSQAEVSAPLCSSEFFASPTVRAEVLGFLTMARSGATLYEIEGALRHLVRFFSGRLLELLAEALQKRDQGLGTPLCPECSTRMHRNRLEPHSLHLLEGTLDFLRQYWECRTCNVYLHALDRDLDLPKNGEVAPRFGHDLCRLGVELPYRTGAEVLEVLTGRELAPKTLRSQVCREGEALLGLERQEAEAYADRDPQERKIRLKALPKLRSTPVPHGMLVVELDGVIGNLGADPGVKAEIEAWKAQEEAARKAEQVFDKSRPSVFRETLNGRFYRLEDRVQKTTKNGKLRSQIMQSETVTVVNDPGLFKQRIYAVKESWFDGGWGTQHYEGIAVLGDGAIFDREFHDTLRPLVRSRRFLEILDFNHGKSHVYECGRALFGEDAKSEARAWGKRWSDSLFGKGAGPLLEELRRLLQGFEERKEDPPRKLVNLRDYVERHRQRMRYPYFRQLGLPIASGAVESVNRSLFGDRCKRSGMGWKKSSMQSLLSLRAALKSSNWEEACAAIRQTRSIRNVTPGVQFSPNSTKDDQMSEESHPEDLLEAERRHRIRPRSRPIGPPLWKAGQRQAAGLLDPRRREAESTPRLAA